MPDPTSNTIVRATCATTSLFRHRIRSPRICLAAFDSRMVVSGTGGAARDIAVETGARVTGIAMSPIETARADEAAEAAGLSRQVEAVTGDIRKMAFAEASFDAAWAIYSLKYLPRLDAVFAEVSRVLRPGALLVVYDILKTRDYDPQDPDHVRVVRDFEYGCAMPEIHTAQEMIEAGAAVGLRCCSELDLATRYAWTHYFEAGALPWLVSSPLVKRSVRALERRGLVPRGFANFNETFASGNVELLLDASRLGILSGSALLVFEREEAA
jgi:SAM-dependent methyltransferase